MLDSSLRPLVFVYIAFAVKHVLCDYVFQTAWMAAGKNADAGWAKPLLAHTGIHAAGTLAICLVFAPGLWWLAAVDFLIHTTIDRTKAILTHDYRPDEQRYWTAFGLDQFAHQITHFAFVLVIAGAR